MGPSPPMKTLMIQVPPVPHNVCVTVWILWTSHNCDRSADIETQITCTSAHLFLIYRANQFYPHLKFQARGSSVVKQRGQNLTRCLIPTTEPLVRPLGDQGERPLKLKCFNPCTYTRGSKLARPLFFGGQKFAQLKLQENYLTAAMHGPSCHCFLLHQGVAAKIMTVDMELRSTEDTGESVKTVILDCDVTCRLAQAGKAFGKLARCLRCTWCVPQRSLCTKLTTVVVKFCSPTGTEAGTVSRVLLAENSWN